MTQHSTLRHGLISTALAALCCFTPLLVVLLGAAGLSAWLGWLDYLLFPILFTSLGSVAQALYLRAGKIGPRPDRLILSAVAALSALLFWLEFRFALSLSLAIAAAVGGYGFFLRAATARRDSQLTNPQADRSTMDQKS
jgi:hypothetical protein